MFLGTNNLTNLLFGSDIISPYDKERIKNGAYELSLGAQAFLTDSSEKKVKELKESEKIEIKPGQFALLLTKEYLKMPETKVAFISIKAGIKFKGLVNVSGFHVDPGFQGKLLFSVYNAGPSSIILSQGTPYFPLWFAEVNETQKYTGSHDKQTGIPDVYVEALSQGELASPNALSKRIDEVEQTLKNKIEEVSHTKKTNEWVVRTILGLVIAFGLKILWDNIRLNEAIQFGYNKRVHEIKVDSLYHKIDSDNSVRDSLVTVTSSNATTLQRKVDSLINVLKRAQEKGETTKNRK